MKASTSEMVFHTPHNDSHLEGDELLHNGRGEQRQLMTEPLHLELNARQPLGPHLHFQLQIEELFLSGNMAKSVSEKIGTHL